MTTTRYDILGVSKNASEDEIRKAYRKLAVYLCFISLRQSFLLF